MPHQGEAAAEPPELAALHAAIAECHADPLAFGAAVERDLRPGRRSVAGRLFAAFVAAAEQAETLGDRRDAPWDMLVAFASVMNQAHGQPRAALHVMRLAAGHPGATPGLATLLRNDLARQDYLVAVDSAREDAKVEHYGSALRHLDAAARLTTDPAELRAIAVARGEYRHARRKVAAWWFVWAMFFAVITAVFIAQVRFNF
jgi:hypothetical protein